MKKTAFISVVAWKQIYVYYYYYFPGGVKPHVLLRICAANLISNISHGVTL
jgi:hypothetical protein